MNIRKMIHQPNKNSRPSDIRFVVSEKKNALIKFALCVTLFIFIVFPLFADETSLYPGITTKQHELAVAALQSVNNLEWDQAEDQMLSMMDLEEQDSLPPLSYLLRVSMRIVRLQNNEYEQDSLKSSLTKEVQALSTRGMELATTSRFHDSSKATIMFINGGIKGFAATLDIESNAFRALNRGIESVKCLDSVQKMAPQIKDTYLGLGLFNCLLAKYPNFLKFVFSFFKSQNVSLETGLNQLRLCANDALYTKTVAQQYLVQYLSPYIDSQKIEKKEIFNSLQSRFPNNPFFMFLDLDEALTFYPESLFASQKLELYTIRSKNLSSRNFSQQKYANLVQWQLFALDTTPEPEQMPDTILPPLPFSYYPVFVYGIKTKLFFCQQNDFSKDNKPLVHRMNQYRDRAFNLLNNSRMNFLRKPYFKWHIKDGLAVN